MKTEEIVSSIKGREIANLTSSLIKLRSVNPPGNEKETAEYIASWFDRRGFESLLTGEAKSRPNVHVKFEGEAGRGKTLVLNGHMDVVPTGVGWTRDPFGGAIENGRVYGRGSGDMKGALASMMVVMETMRRRRREISGSIVFQAVCDEEVGTPMGTGHLVKRGVDADFAIVGEPTGLDVCTCHKGIVNYEITTYGKAAHASVPRSGVSAILAMQLVIDGLTKYAKSQARKVKHPLLGSPTVNIGVIEGGTKTNIVPDRCRVAGERRVVPPETASQAASQLQSAVRAVASATRISCDVRITHRIEPSEAKARAEVMIKGLLAAVERVTGKRRRPVGFVAACDARYFNNLTKVPAVVCGPGRLGNVHTADEYVEIKELEQAAKAYAFMFLENFQ